jgi:hypothetical protein
MHTPARRIVPMSEATNSLLAVEKPDPIFILEGLTALNCFKAERLKCLVKA